MGWKQDYATLRQRVINKTGQSEQALDKQVTRRVSSHHMSAGAALYSIARENDINSTRDFNKLSEADKSKVTFVLNLTQNISNSKNVIQNANMASSGAKVAQKISRPSTRHPEMQEPWYKRPFGQILIAIAAGVVVLVIGILINHLGWK